jgi:hypothetical protein
LLRKTGQTRTNHHNAFFSLRHRIHVLFFRATSTTGIPQQHQTQQPQEITFQHTLTLLQLVTCIMLDISKGLDSNFSLQKSTSGIMQPMQNRG